jgi:hypothetical protein
MADALGAEIRINYINFIPLTDGAIGAFGLTHIAVDTLVGNDQGHFKTPEKSGIVPWIISCIRYNRIN